MAVLPMRRTATRRCFRTRFRFSAALLTIALAAAAFFGVVAAAQAGTVTSWYGIQPTGTTNTGAGTILISGTATPKTPSLQAATAKMFVDGVSIPQGTGTGHFSVVITTYSTYQTVAFTYPPSPPLADGTRTLRVEVSDAGGALSYYQWSVNVKQPPTATWVAPPYGSTVYSGSESIVMSLADNTPSTTMQVNGALRTGGGTTSNPIVATFGGTVQAGQRSFAPSVELPVGVYYATATVTDAAGNATTLVGAQSLKFTVASAPPMTVFPDCTTCHSVAPGHPPDTSCAVCHPTEADFGHSSGGACDDCHSVPHWEGATPCVTCHGPAYPEYNHHDAANLASTHASSCNGCHNKSLIAQHAVTPAGSSYPNQCDMCHASSNPRVQAAITNKDTSCSACHDAHGTSHDSVLSPGCTDSDCHGSDVPAIHNGDCTTCHAGGDGAAPAGATCTTCHPGMTTRHAYGPWFLNGTIGSNTNYAGYLSWGYISAQAPSGNAGQTPHGNYATTTNKCQVCHAVHRAQAGGSVLTAIPSASVRLNTTNQTAGAYGSGSSSPNGYTKGCAWCHSTGGFATTIALNSDGSLQPHSECSPCHTASPHGGPGVSAYKVLAANLLNKRGDLAIAADLASGNNGMDPTWFGRTDGSVALNPALASTGLTLGTGYICNGCHSDGSGAQADGLTFAVNAPGAVPSVLNDGAAAAVAGSVTGHRVTAVVTDWNGSTSTTYTGGVWNPAVARRYNAFYTGGSFFGGEVIMNPAGQSTIAWAPSNSCQACHDQKTSTGTYAFPHGYVNTAGTYVGEVNGQAGYIWMTQAASSVASRTVVLRDSNQPNQTLSQDGLCLKCHVKDGTSGQGVGLNF